MKLISLFESDDGLRRLERLALERDPHSVMKLAQEYLRTNSPEIDNLIEALREIEEPEAQAMIQLWAHKNDIPTAEAFVQDIFKPRGDNARGGRPRAINFNLAAADLENAKFWLVEHEEVGRSGYDYQVKIYESPMDNNYVWLVRGYEEGAISFNYGPINREHLDQAREDGIMDYFREYLE